MYDPYNPYGYMFPNHQASPMPYAPMGTTQLPQQVPQQVPQNGSPAVLQVATLNQVEQTQVPAGGKALVLVGNAPVIAMRVADSMGITTTDYYHIEKFDPNASAPVAGSDFITRAELQQALEQFAMQLPQMSAGAANEKEAAKK